MAGALKKLAKSGIENVGDFLKSFRKKTYYHVSPEPDIEEFKINQPSPLDFMQPIEKGEVPYTLHQIPNLLKTY